MSEKSNKVYDNPKLQDFQIEGVKHIHPEDAFEQVKNSEAFLLDIREEDEVEQEHVEMPDTIYLPMLKIMDRIDSLPDNKLIYIICTTGIRSTKIVNLLNHQGIRNVANIDGGIVKWKSCGLPVKINNNSSQCCGCSCGS